MVINRKFSEITVTDEKAKIGAMKSTEDSFLVELLTPASTLLKRSIDDIDAMGLSEIESELNIKVFPMKYKRGGK